MAEKWILRLLNIAHIVLAILLCAALGVFLVLSFYTWPSAADDLCLANYFEKEGVFGGLYGKYMEVSGGYTSIFLMGAVPQLGDYYAFYKYLPLTLLLLTVWAGTGFSRAVLRLGDKSVWHWLLGIGFTLVFLSCMPSVVAGFYWFASAIKYQGANLLFIGMLVLFARLLESTGQALASRSKDFILFGLCIIAGVGSSETLMVLFYAVASLMCLWRISAEDSNCRAALVWLGLLLLLNLCTAIFIFAPGNAVRASQIGTSQLSLTVLLNMGEASIFFGFKSLEKMLSLPQIWWASLISVAIILRNNYLRNDFVSNRLPRMHGAYVLLGVMFSLLTPIFLQWPSLFILDGPPPLRTVNSILFGTLLCWLVTLSLLVHWVLNKWPSTVTRLAGGTLARRTVPIIIYLLALVGFGTALVSSPNLQTAFDDLNNVAPDYDAHMRARLVRLEEVRDTGAPILLSQYLEPPTTNAHFDMITPDGSIDFRPCFAEYFGVIPIVEGFDK